MLRLLSIVALASTVASQAITAGAMKGILKYADPALVTTLTTNLNKDTTLAAQKKRLAAWVPKNFVKTGTKADATDPVGTSAKALAKAQAFVAHRDGLKKYINYAFAQLVSTKFTTQAIANNMKKIWWDTDKAQNNNYKLTGSIAISKAAALLPKDKQALVQSSLSSMAAGFAKANAEASKNLMAYQW